MALELRNRQQVAQNKEEKVQMLKVLFIRTYFFKKLVDHWPYLREVLFASPNSQNPNLK